MTNTLPPAHWAADPSGRHEYRYWDGARWTDHVSDRGAVSVDAIDGAPPQTAVVAAEVAAEPLPVNADGLLVPLAAAPAPPPPAAGTAFSHRRANSASASRSTGARSTASGPD